MNSKKWIFALLYAMLGVGIGSAFLVFAPALLPGVTIFIAASGVVYFLLFGDRSSLVWRYMPITFIGSIIFVLYVELIRNVSILNNPQSVGIGYVGFITSLILVWHPVLYQIVIDREDEWLRLNKDMLEDVRQRIVGKIT